MKLNIEGEFIYDEETMHSGNLDQESKLWFMKEILLSEDLAVHSNEIGDEIGILKIKVVEEARVKSEKGFTEEELKDLRHNASDDTIG